MFNSIDQLNQSAHLFTFPTPTCPPLVYAATLQSNNKGPRARKHLYHYIPIVQLHNVGITAYHLILRFLFGMSFETVKSSHNVKTFCQSVLRVCGICRFVVIVTWQTRQGRMRGPICYAINHIFILGAHSERSYSHLRHPNRRSA